MVDSGDNELWRAYSRKVDSEECCAEDGVGGRVEQDSGALSESDGEESLRVVLMDRRGIVVTYGGFHLRKKRARSILPILQR